MESRQDRIEELESEYNSALLSRLRVRVEREEYLAKPVEDRRLILTQAIDAVVVSHGSADKPLDQRVQILWPGEGPDDLPRRRHDNGPIGAFDLQ